MKTNYMLALAGTVALALAACTDRPARDGYDQPGIGSEETPILLDKEEGTPKTAQRVDINRLDADDFVALGMSKDSAERVTDYRDQHGNFASVADLSRVPGVDKNWLQQNKDRLGVKYSGGGA